MDLQKNGERVGLFHPVTVVPGMNIIFIFGPLLDAGDKTFPDAGLASGSQRVRFFMPAVEIADDKDPLRIGGPDGKIDPGDAVSLQPMAPQLLVEAEVVAFIKDKQVIGTEK